MPIKEFRLHEYAIMALLVLPWMNPFATGPSPNVFPWLISALCGVVLLLLRRKLDIDLIARGWAIAAVLSAAVALVQYFGLAHAIAPWVSQANVGEAFANLRQRNQFATLTSMGLVALIGLCAQRSGPADALWTTRLAILMLAFGNAASGSRTGLLQWILLLGLYAWWSAPGRRLAMGLAFQAVTLYLVAVFALPRLLEIATGMTTDGLLGRLAERPTCGSRKVLWDNVLTLIAQKPWAGWGWGELDYAHFLTLYEGPRFCEILDNAHNLPLQLAVELGIPAALCAGVGVGCLLWRERPWNEAAPGRQMAWGVLAVIMLHSMLEYPLWYGPFQLALGLCIWLLWASPAGRKASERVALQAGLLLRSLSSVLSVTAVAVLIYAGIDYHRVSQIYLPQPERSLLYRDDTLSKIRDTWLFRQQVAFAELSITPLRPDNAAAMHDLAKALLHYSPEPRVVEKLIESAVILGWKDEALYYSTRYRAAFPEEYARWAGSHGLSSANALLQ